MFRLFFALLCALALPGVAGAQAYPAKPIRMIVPFTPGGGTDFVTRLVATRLADATKWTIVVENKPGMQSPEVRATLLAQGVEVLTGTPDDFTARLQADLAKSRKVVETANLKFE